MPDPKDFPDALQGGEPTGEQERVGEAHPWSPRRRQNDPARQESSLEPTDKTPRTPEKE